MQKALDGFYGEKENVQNSDPFGYDGAYNGQNIAENDAEQQMRQKMSNAYF